MSREAWDNIKQSKRFYVVMYRRMSNALAISSGLNLLLGVALYYVYFNRGAPDFYATSGVTPPVELTALTAPNYTTVPLLATEPENNEEEKVIPQ